MTILESKKKIQSYGITIFASFVIGFDCESNRTAENIIKCIQDSGLCMVMLAKLEALPHTQLTRRLKIESRFLKHKEDGSNSIIEKDNWDFRRDYWCCSSGLNFITDRPRLDILKDYISILENIYCPDNYFNRIIYYCLNLKPANKYKPVLFRKLKLLNSFLTTCKKLGFSKTTAWLYWKMLFEILFKNPRAIEAAVTLSVMFIHFFNQSKYIIDTTKEEIKYIEDYGEENYIKLIFQ
jgi:hypothetical protein